MSEFVPLPEIDRTVCQLPLPNGFDEERLGVNIDRFRSIAALGGFIADRTRVISVSGETSSESIGITGTSGDSAFGAMTGTASKANTADSETEPDYVDFGADSMRMAGPLTITLNSSEIAQRVQRRSPAVREPKPWASQIDRALRLEMTKAIWRDTFTAPTFAEGGASAAGVIFLGLCAAGAAPDTPAMPALAALGYAGTLNLYRFLALRTADRRLQEEHFSLAPFFHIDRATAATARLACGRLVKALD